MKDTAAADRLAGALRKKCDKFHQIRFECMTMMNDRKRPRSPDATIPPEDCTRDTFDQHANLSDRQFLSWALQTEARVRFEKLEARDAHSTAQDTTLNSEYLIDLYPDNGEIQVQKGELERERHAFARKSIPYLQSTRAPDSSFETLTRLEIRRLQSDELQKPSEASTPPNLLYFQILLEAYMGYCVPNFHSTDPSQPRAAVMGGALVATLASWRDYAVRTIFTAYKETIVEALKSRDVRKYNNAREDLRSCLHRYFIHPCGWSSPFSLGDVDLFLQASPLTRSLTNKLSDLPLDVRGTIGSFVGGCGYVHRDLHVFADKLCNGHLQPLFKSTGNEDEYYESTFCYALASNGLSFALGTGQRDHYEDASFDPNIDTWPRTTQLIMLNEKADLVGGLMDFDISVASCAYDGVSVYATPRAAFSLKTLTQVVTPFVFEERRNRSRITKYYQRGFDAFVIDPYCSHESQCYENGSIIAQESATASDTIEVAKWEAIHLTSYERYQEICDAQNEWRSTRTHPWRSREWDQEITICRQGGRCNRHTYTYSAALIEKSEGHAIEYFAKRDNWSEEFRQRVMAAPEAGRLVCINCRKEYGLQLVLDKAPTTVQSVETVDELLHGEVSYAHTVGHCGDFGPSFYSGGAFSSLYVGPDARTWYQLLGVMRAQQIIEKARYIRKYGSAVGHKQRFVYDDDLAHVFRMAGDCNLPANGRAPVGLNPERFIARCKGCQDWLHGCEFGVQYCEKCMESKPPAVND